VTAPPDTAAVPSDWPDVSDGLPLLPLWPFLSAEAKAEIKQALACLRRPAHQAVEVHCRRRACRAVLGLLVDGDLVAGGVRVDRGRCGKCGWRLGRRITS
jgi:hypothetical protein